jgi:transposase
MSRKKYRPWNPDQMVLFPHAMKDALEEGHIVFRILDVVESLDISSVTDQMDEIDARGTRPYHPRMMLALLMYGYCCGIYSSRKIAAATYDIIPFRVLTADQHPHFTVINEFRLRHLDAFVDLFVQVLRLCGRAGLLDLEHVSLDGSKLEANASKHKAMSYGRMEVEVERLEREIREFSARAVRVDAEEDELYGKGNEAQQIRQELRRREERLKRIAGAKMELEQEARRGHGQELRERARRQLTLAETEVDPTERKRKRTRARKGEEKADRLAGGEPDAGSDDGGQDGEHPLTSHRVASTPKGMPRPEAQRNFTDPDSRIMKRGATYLQGYNCQIVVDGANQVIVAEGVTNQAPDQEHLIPMMQRTRRNTGRLPKRLSADAGYMSEENVEFCQHRDIDAYLAVSRGTHGSSGNGEAPPQEKKVWRAMRDKLSTDEGRQIYSRRKTIVEPVFGQAKEARGFRRFSLRGLKKVRAEWALVCLCSNLLKLVNAPLSGHRIAAETA